MDRKGFVSFFYYSYQYVLDFTETEKTIRIIKLYN